MRFLIWGAGAIGGTIGAHLARAGHEITLADRARDHVAAIDAAGLRIEGPLTRFTVRVPAFTPDALRGEVAHNVLAVQAPDTQGGTPALAPHPNAHRWGRSPHDRPEEP